MNTAFIQFIFILTSILTIIYGILFGNKKVKMNFKVGKKYIFPCNGYFSYQNPQTFLLEDEETEQYIFRTSNGKIIGYFKYIIEEYKKEIYEY